MHEPTHGALTWHINTQQLVAIVDPHLKRDDDYYVYKEAKDLDILCKQPDGKTELEGWCWPGSSSWVDWFNPTSHDWWIKMFRFDKFKVLPRLSCPCTHS